MTGRRHDTDITLLLEGTYPFVRGGVSGWVHQLIEGLPELSFALVYLGAERPEREDIRYPLPPNVQSLACHYLMEGASIRETRVRAGNPAYFSASADMHAWFRSPEGAPEPPATLSAGSRRSTTSLREGRR